MVTTILLEQDLELGRQILKALDRKRFPLVAAFWLFHSESDEWRLVLASPKVEQLGGLATYSEIFDILQKTKLDVPLDRLQVMESENPLILSLRWVMGTKGKPFIGGKFYPKLMAGNRYLDGVYLYRAESLIGESGSFTVWLAKRNKETKTWTVKPCTLLSNEKGHIQKVESEGKELGHSREKNGVTAQLHVAVNIVKTKTKTLGEIQRWAILDGRLLSIDSIAKDALIEEMP